LESLDLPILLLEETDWLGIRMVAYLCTEVCDLLSGLDTLLGGSGGGSLGGGAINLCGCWQITT